jgi:lipopolysaccharide transport system ATP-binding protein
MSDTVIRVENLSKQYVLGKTGGSEGLRHAIHEAATAPFRWFKSLGRQVENQESQKVFPAENRKTATEFWALRNVSFKVKQGEVLGIIGRNGAGKSTLLKILSRITEPTEGKIRISGRVASLLEVGTGFHPELTGRENIFLNGAILGMSRGEIRKKFDEIVAFAEVEKFLDTPVKRYSSGMYVRLAFAVAAHLEPEILIVDEVLAVGDFEFQRKCLGKMQDVASQQGRTVLFVSHNMLAVQKLCTNGLLLEKGAIKAAGLIHDIIANHLSTGATDVYSNLELNGHPQILAAKILTPFPRTDTHLEVMVEWVLPIDLRGVKIGIGFNTSEGQRIFDCAPEDFGLRSPDKQGRHRAKFQVPAHTLMARHYAVSIGLWKESTVFDHPNPALKFSVEPAPSGPYSHQSTRDGFVNIKCDWHFLS